MYEYLHVNSYYKHTALLIVSYNLFSSLYEHRFAGIYREFQTQWTFRKCSMYFHLCVLWTRFLSNIHDEIDVKHNLKYSPSFYIFVTFKVKIDFQNIRLFKFSIYCFVDSVNRTFVTFLSEFLVNLQSFYDLFTLFRFYFKFRWKFWTEDSALWFRTSHTRVYSFYNLQFDITMDFIHTYIWLWLLRSFSRFYSSFGTFVSLSCSRLWRLFYVIPSSVAARCVYIFQIFAADAQSSPLIRNPFSPTSYFTLYSVCLLQNQNRAFILNRFLFAEWLEFILLFGLETFTRTMKNRKLRVPNSVEPKGLFLSENWKKNISS